MVRMKSKGQISEVREVIATIPRDLIVVVGVGGNPEKMEILLWVPRLDLGDRVDDDDLN